MPHTCTLVAPAVALHIALEVMPPDSLLDQPITTKVIIESQHSATNSQDPATAYSKINQVTDLQKVVYYVSIAVTN